MNDPCLSPPRTNAAVKLISFVVPPLASHLISSMGVARQLQTLGHRVEFWGDAKIKEESERGGYGFRNLEGLRGMWSPEIALPQVPWLHPIQTTRSLLVRRQWKKSLRTDMTRLGEAIDQLVHTQRPDLVVFDPFRLAYSPFVGRRGVAACLLSTKALATPDPSAPPHTSGLVPQPTWLGRLRDSSPGMDVRWESIAFLSGLLRRAQHIQHMMAGLPEVVHEAVHGGAEDAHYAHRPLVLPCRD